MHTLEIQLSRNCGIPVAQQIENQVRMMVDNGKLQPGQQLPSPFDLAEQLMINPNTVASVYRELEISGTVVSVEGAGIYVSRRKSSLTRAGHLKILTEHADALVMTARQLGFSNDEVIEVVRQRLMETMRNAS